MQKQSKFGALDSFRMIAALLVIAIHTSPLTSFSESGDFFFTRVLARIAVPFFFMVTGHFTLSDRSLPLLGRRLKKLCLLYGAAILLYLPLGIYAGHYQALTFGGAIRMLLFDGSFYHLWYFPACIVGMLLVALFLHFLPLRAVAILSSFLYIIGLLGDSYFGLAEKIPALHSMYDGLFHLFSYTRNGLFLAPVFLTLGIYMSDSSHSSLRGAGQDDSTVSRRHFRFLAVGLLLSFFCMTAEAFLLRSLNWQRHDSMYLFLVPVMFFLYRLLLALPLPSRKILRTASTWIYLLHPLFIVVVRGAAKVLGLSSLLIENSLLHYLAVALLSTGTGLLLPFALSLLQKQAKRRGLSQRKKSSPAEEPASEREETEKDQTAPQIFCQKTGRAWIELNLTALENNVQYLRSLVPASCQLMPAVKANAYGHGAEIIAGKLNRLGISSFCVASVSEGIALRKTGISGEILILGYTHPDDFPQLIRFRLTQTVIDFPYALLLQKNGQRLHVHIAVDTGMHRLGIRCEDYSRIAAVYEMENLIVDGIFTHLAACDSDSAECRSFTETQIQVFFRVTRALLEDGLPCRGLHLLSSYGILNYPGAAADYVRPGIALYGVLSNDKLLPQLQPVLSLKTRVASLRTLQAGEAAGYGLDYIAKQNMQIAVIAIGYADGLPRNFSENNGYVLINGCKAPVVGRVCMDQTLVNVSEIPEVQAGDAAVVIGKSGALEISAGELAVRCGTIANELLSRLGHRLERINIDERL